MKTNRIAFLGTALIALSGLPVFSQTEAATKGSPAPKSTLTVQVDRPAHDISPMLYGIFVEDIYRAVDGGLYAEMVQNRSFEDAPAPIAWSLDKEEGADASMALDKKHPLNPNNPTSLRLEVRRTGGARVAVVNQGFKGHKYNRKDSTEALMKSFEQAEKQARNGIFAEAGKTYEFSLRARRDADFRGPLTVSLEDKDGKVLASQEIAGLETEWKKFAGSLIPTETAGDARLVVSTKEPGTVWLDMVSLFPKHTFKGRPNGVRADLGEALAGMHPAFVRFPGGCFVEGALLADAFRWKKTIGDIAERPGNWNLWGYFSSNGMGYHEYLQFCEDLGAEPLFVINAGMAHADEVPMDQMGEWVQDALDAIEYANGPADSPWGSLRAKAGHPEPFHLKYLQIGNENVGPPYQERFALMRDAIKARYPEMQILSCEPLNSKNPGPRPEMVDEHIYDSAIDLASRSRHFDGYDRSGNRIYMGEYSAVNKGRGWMQQFGALGEAIFMAGMERNSDVVLMSSYAALMGRSEWNWSSRFPTAMLFDSSRVVLRPSYHVQALFAGNTADQLLPLEVDTPPWPIDLNGIISFRLEHGVRAEYRDIRVFRDGKTLLKADLMAGAESLPGFKNRLTKFKTENGVLSVESGRWDAHIEFGQKDWSDITLEFQVRRVAGEGGLKIAFGEGLWNIGDVGERAFSADFPIIKPGESGALENGRWYDVKLEVRGTTVRCYLDGKLVKEGIPSLGTLTAVAGRKRDTGEIILKVVNISNEPQTSTLRLNGAGKLAPEGKAIVLAANDPAATNTFENPDQVVPVESAIPVTAPEFRHTFPANSLTILRLPTQAKQ